MEKPESIKVEAYLCGTCKFLRHSKEEADICCRCECGVALEKDPEVMGRGHGYRGTGSCKVCCYKTWLKRQREDVRRDQEHLDSAKAHLAKTEAEASEIPELAKSIRRSQRNAATKAS